MDKQQYSQQDGVFDSIFSERYRQSN